MQWIAPSEKDSATTTLEKRLWDAADQFRANSGLKPQEYSGPILGLIFLRFAEVRFAVLRAKLEAAGTSLAGDEGAQHGKRERRGAEAADMAHGIFSGNTCAVIVVMCRRMLDAMAWQVSAAFTGVPAQGSPPPTYDAVCSLAANLTSR